MNPSPEGAPQPAEPAPVSPRFVTLLTALALSTAVSLLSHRYVSELTVERRLTMSRLVLERGAYFPYQHDMYLVSVVSQWLQDSLGIGSATSFSLTFVAGYLLLFLSVWALLTRLYRKPGAVMLGLFAVATYACLLMPYGNDHAGDPYGAAMIALALLAAQRGSAAGVGLASAAGGFFWGKSLLLAPIILLYEGRLDHWRRGVALAALVVVASAVGPVVCHLPHNPIVPEGIMTHADWVKALPGALVKQIGFALPPLLSLLALRRRIDPVVRAGALLYPLMIVIYAAASFYLFELRSFWAVVPVFVAVLAAWGEVTDPETERP